MQTLANILAGVPGNPMQQSQGIAPLEMQDMLSQQMGQQLSANNPPATLQTPVNPANAVPGAGSGFGSLGATALPLLMAGGVQ